MGILLTGRLFRISYYGHQRWRGSRGCVGFHGLLFGGWIYLRYVCFAICFFSIRCLPMINHRLLLRNHRYLRKRCNIFRIRMLRDFSGFLEEDLWIIGLSSYFFGCWRTRHQDKSTDLSISICILRHLRKVGGNHSCQ